MKKLPLLIALVAAPAALCAAEGPNDDNPLPRHFPTKARYAHEFAGGGGAGGNLGYHGGPVLTTANVIPIFWGPSWNSAPTPNMATSLTAYIQQSPGGYGVTGEYNVITQYYEVINNVRDYIAKSNLGSAGSAIYDNSTPPTNVTDADVQAEVLKVTSNSPRTDTIYEVFLPSASYSSNGSATSCGGPNLQYCAYHGSFTSGGLNVKYASMPYPSCGGCQTTGFTDTQNLEHFISHESREAVTDENGNAWYDRRGYEADDKCAWNPTPFTDATNGTNSDGSAFAYQYEWSNANSACIKTR